MEKTILIVFVAALIALIVPARAAEPAAEGFGAGYFTNTAPAALEDETAQGLSEIAPAAGKEDAAVSVKEGAPVQDSAEGQRDDAAATIGITPRGSNTQ